MPNYQLGKIYKIVSNQTNDIYVGSTTKKYLSSRLAHHKCSYKRFQNGKGRKTTSFKLIQYDDAQIILLENVKCDSKDELHARERHYVEILPNVINKQVPNRTKKEFMKEYWKKYSEDNKESINKKNICECGSPYTNVNKSHHMKTKKHLNYLENKKE